MSQLHRRGDDFKRAPDSRPMEQDNKLPLEGPAVLVTLLLTRCCAQKIHLPYRSGGSPSTGSAGLDQAFSPSVPAVWLWQRAAPDA